MFLSEMNLVLGEIEAQLVGRRLKGVRQPARDRVVVQIGISKLLVVATGRHQRVHLTGESGTNPKRPFSFQGACRARLRGRLLALHHGGTDRWFELVFDRGRLHVRFCGRGSGCWLIKDDIVVAGIDGPAPRQLPPMPDGPPRHRPARFDAASGGWNVAAASFFEAREAEETADQLLHLEGRRAARAKKREQRRRSNLHDDLKRARSADALQGRADALANILHTLPQGAHEAEIGGSDGFETIRFGSHTPTHTLQLMYRRAARLRRAVPIIEARIALLESVHRKPSEAPKAAPRTDWYTWRGPHAALLFVGRNERGNRALVFGHARKEDFWFHLRDRPGAHVVLRLPTRGASPKEEDLLAAGQLVLISGRVPKGGTAEVQYTRVKHLRPVGGDGCRVTVRREQVLLCARNEGALVGWERQS
jgi:predicted ribosome quality control (RQC) complex YloA/Tae2 family protein